MACKIIFTALFTALVEPIRFASSIVTLWGYKASVVAPMKPTSSHTISHRSSTPFHIAKKKEENREIDLQKQEGVVELTWSHLSFPSIPWQSRDGPLQTLHKSICKTS
jgi:hypothetical protein